MNEATNLELAAKFAADQHWRWLPGVRYQYVARPDAGWLRVRDSAHADALNASGGDGDDGPVALDVDDPATLGCIEHDLVPAALADPDACLCFNPHERNWFVYSPKHDDCTTSKATKAGALLAALEEADDIARGAPAGEKDAPSVIHDAYKWASQHAVDPFVGSVEDFARLVGQGFDVPGFREDGADVRRACREWSGLPEQPEDPAP